ncbi:hypothetical protein [Taibaiella chishuiensis]|uniref:PNKP (Polynucleotide 5'-kinase/3'-phosphatase) family adenylyltransferase-like protein n=1 Tax=Taibaiella chishuiensis TaxID=1434707 RepID=A0A2P8DAU4_9BACT|nr:hypothetical protein [Taibaiella chishuiensis]PSK94329.1 PNKP (polynucleotide 5'-kinase/3'-phosphatase) family adenylyltransferase-like protein [Taibaiella chishuiensis]
MNELKQQKEDLKKLRSRINWFCDHKINAFSPTISPAPKSEERGEIESLHEGIRYYVKRGVTELLVQKKYMGSYCDIYLHRDLDATYFVSRNGHLIQHIDLEAARQACQAMHARLDWDGVQLVIIQAEMMPWSILGKGLIDNEFEGYLDAHQQHLAWLEGSALYEKIRQVKAGQPFCDFVRDKAALSAKALKQRYPGHIIRQYTAMEAFVLTDLERYRQGTDIYAKQIRHFGEEVPLHFKPFNVLKKVYEDGREEIVNDNASYSVLNDDTMLELHIPDEAALERESERACAWFAALSAACEEGVVIKPRQAFLPGLPPALKVRNNHYLTMIYGIDFIPDLDHHITRRNIKAKLACSVNDWALNYNLLSVPYADLHKENYYLKNLVYDRIMGEKTEALLDTRL